MGFVLVLSLPFILFTVLLGFGCFLLGRAKGREEARAAVYAAPMAPPEVVARKEGPGNEMSEIEIAEGGLAWKWILPRLGITIAE
ncbi:hypothetical protein ZIOFF_069476 [Zingiber officinale]|uniref:Uncharacterized protein n=1 Tax=Zingiber officinale TaxID=94328 RepID=A0A8J5BH31_ZINOF|nr:hypothetical protein ZIOFF_069476 [Zingiber officinale]